MVHAMAWLNLQDVMVRSQREELIYWMTLFKRNIQIDPWRPNTDWWLPRTGVGEDGMGRNCLTGKRFYFGMMEILCKWVEVVAVRHWECTEFHSVPHFKKVNFMLCDIHLVKSRNSRILHIMGKRGDK